MNTFCLTFSPFLFSLIPVLSGCASFNDSLVVDIGDQFELLKLEVDEGPAGKQGWPPKHGFECDFDARSKRLSLWDRERQVSGTIRCRGLGAR